MDLRIEFSKFCGFRANKHHKNHDSYGLKNVMSLISTQADLNLPNHSALLIFTASLFQFRDDLIGYLGLPLIQLMPLIFFNHFAKILSFVVSSNCVVLTTYNNESNVFLVAGLCYWLPMVILVSYRSAHILTGNSSCKNILYFWRGGACSFPRLFNKWLIFYTFLLCYFYPLWSMKSVLHCVYMCIWWLFDGCCSHYLSIY